MMQAVFLDKDGTLIENVPYNVDPGRIRLTPGAEEGLRRLHAAGYRLIVISNQSGVARGLFPEEALVAVERRLRGLLAEAGVPLLAFYYCPHHPEGVVPGLAVACACRKPEPGLILRAAETTASTWALLVRRRHPRRRGGRPPRRLRDGPDRQRQRDRVDPLPAADAAPRGRRPRRGGAPDRDGRRPAGRRPGGATRTGGRP
jgi:histidinol-phosphate phosphatase family protein